MIEASSFQSLLVNFSSIFTEPSFKNFVTLHCGWLLCNGRRTISRVIQAAVLNSDAPRHHSVFYRFFSRAIWNPSKLGEVTLQLILTLLPEDAPIILTVDDTLCRKSGAQIWGGGMHHDALLSNYGRGKSLVKFFSFGHNWVIVCACVQTPWNQNRWMAIPVAFRLYRSKKRCPKEQYRKRTELARDCVIAIDELIPKDRRILLLGDSEYACREVVRGLPKRFVFVGPMSMDAALYAPPPAKQIGRGRPRVKGKRLMSPKQLIAADDIHWESHKMLLYGKTVVVLAKTQTCLWYTVAGTKLVRMLVTRDPSGRIEERAYFSTDEGMSVSKIAQTFSLRWTQEEMHRNVKQHLGLEDPQNGWWRRPKGQRRDKRIPGPQPHKERGDKAVTRTVPFMLTTYAIVVLWYMSNGHALDDVERSRRRAPWYRKKTEPSFGDILAALRRQLWAERIFREPCAGQGVAKIPQVVLDWLCAA